MYNSFYLLYFRYFQERHAILTILDGSNLDSGLYRIVAENDLGMDSANIDIQISGIYLTIF